MHLNIGKNRYFTIKIIQCKAIGSFYLFLSKYSIIHAFIPFHQMCVFVFLFSHRFLDRGIRSLSFHMKICAIFKLYGWIQPPRYYGLRLEQDSQWGKVAWTLPRNPTSSNLAYFLLNHQIFKWISLCCRSIFRFWVKKELSTVMSGLLLI